MILSFIIPALNEERHLPRCLQSIAALARPPEVTDIEVLVVDSQSRDRTAEVARQLGARVLTVTPGQIARSRNTGARECRGQLLAFVDADCELSPDWLTRGFDHLRAADVVAVGTNIATPPPQAPWVERCWYALAYRPPAVTSQRVDWLMSFNLLLRREAFDRVGGFDEALVSCEDSDFGYKLAACGPVIRDYVAFTVHHGESKTLRQFFRREAWRSRGNLPLVLRQGLALRELPSLLVPPAFVAALGGGAALLLLGLLWPALAWLGGALLLGAVLLPALVVLRKGVSPAAPARFAQCYALFTTYLFARSVGLVAPVGRVKR